MRLTAFLVAIAGTAVMAAPAAIAPADAIATAVARRLGGAPAVTVSDLDTDVVAAPGLEAVPDPAARLGQPARFVLTARGARAGRAVATVTAVTEYPRARRPIGRHEAVDAQAVTYVYGALPVMPLRALPGRDEILGRVARRAIAAGDVLTSAVLGIPAAVQSGDAVSVRVRIGSVEASGTGIASGSGRIGDVIRVRPPHSRSTLHARVTGTGAVEVVP